MEAGRLSVAMATSRDASPERRLSLGVFVVSDGRDAGAPTDPTITLLDLLAHVGDVLSHYQDQVANESYLDVHRGDNRTSLRISLGEGLRPAVCVIADDHRVHLVTVGSETDTASVTFDDSMDGERLPRGAENVSAAYRRGLGDTGEVELRGLDLGESFAVLVLGDPRIAADASFSGGLAREAVPDSANHASGCSRSRSLSADTAAWLRTRLRRPSPGRSNGGRDCGTSPTCGLCVANVMRSGRRARVVFPMRTARELVGRVSLPGPGYEHQTHEPTRCCPAQS